MAEEILEGKNLCTQFKTERGLLKAIDGVSFEVYRGEMLGIVGESGCGKSVTSQSVLRLYNEKNLAVYSGQVRLEDQNLFELSQKEMQKIRGARISMVFQDALSSLNPVFTVGNQIMEALMIHQNISKKEARDKAVEMLRLVGIPDPEGRFYQYPFELSGGMRQRVMIAVALACGPEILIADEPTTALDVTIQAQIMDLIVEMNRKLNMGVMLITHDLAVVAETCHRVLVMYLGQIVEEGLVEDIFDRPLHPYTKGLMASIPRLDSQKGEKLHQIKGTVPVLGKIPEGCRFAPRCPYAGAECRTKTPELKKINESQKVRCHLADTLSAPCA